MSKIFLSHSSANNAQALALARWLQDNGWDEYFLDVQPNHGLAPGERWLAALKQAAHRCEAVICLISPAWRNSPHCLTEFLLAQQLSKTIFGVLIQATPLDTLPAEMTSKWQLCDLVTGTERRTFRVSHDPIVPQTDVSFAEAGLTRLQIGLQRAGLDAASFTWPPPDEPKRAPYRGMKPLEAVDAAVFFGRDAAIVRGLDTLRAMQKQDIERMLVILGASGSGKSSFLRAGLWPRLKRDDVHFLPLPVIRPELAVLSGDSGLIASLETAFNDQGIIKTRASIRDKLQTADGLPQLLSELQQQAYVRISAGLGIQHQPAIPLPTIVIAIDQGEELTNPEGRKEAELFLAMLANLLSLYDSGHDATKAGLKLPLIVVTIRSDAYERLQTEPSLEGNHPRLFDLPPVSPKHYKTVIEGPAACATAAGRKLVIEPALTEQLLHDTSGTDALPLLAFTLERLYVDYGADGDLRLDEYNALGGVRGSIQAAVNAAFAEPDRKPVIPSNEIERNELLKQAFVWLVSVDPHTNERKRRIARWDELPVETYPLLERLIKARLLLRDRRKWEGETQEIVIVEVAHEAFLRQWDILVQWLDAEANNLKALESVQRTASDWINNNRMDDWLIHGGERLAMAEKIRIRSNFGRRHGVDGNAYLAACRTKENALQRVREGTPEYDLKQMAQSWQKYTGLMRLYGLAGWWKLLRFRGLAIQGSPESAFLRWSAARASVNALVLALLVGLVGELAWWTQQNKLPLRYTFYKPLWMLGHVPEPKLEEIPDGKFTMGCVVGRDDYIGCPERETPTREVTILQPFLMGRYELTFLEYDAFVWHMQREGIKRQDGSEWYYPPAEGRDRSDRPVINVSWNDAQAYVQWLSDRLNRRTGQLCRLPTGAEWEYAARGGTPTAYPWGSELGKNNANCGSCGSLWDYKESAPVGSFSPNKFGLYDMAGNVAEWVQDEHDHSDQPTGAETLADDYAGSRVVRGGSWGSLPDLIRPSAKIYLEPGIRNRGVGFRVLCSSPIE